MSDAISPPEVTELQQRDCPCVCSAWHWLGKDMLASSQRRQIKPHRFRANSSRRLSCLRLLFFANYHKRTIRHTFC